MSDFVERFKKGAKAFKDALSPGQYEAANIKVISKTEYSRGTFFNLDGLNKLAKVLVCTRSGLNSVVWRVS